VQLFRSFYDYIEAGNYNLPRPFANFEDGRRELILCEHIQLSAIERRWVEVKY
jgi:hypothetical protein